MRSGRGKGRREREREGLSDDLGATRSPRALGIACLQDAQAALPPGPLRLLLVERS